MCSCELSVPGFIVDSCQPSFHLNVEAFEPKITKESNNYCSLHAGSLRWVQLVGLSKTREGPCL